MRPELFRVVQRSVQTPDTFDLYLDVSGRPGGFPFAPGQFNMLYLYGHGEVPISISGDPARPDQLVHTIKSVGAVTRKLEQLRPGAVLGLRGPYGNGWPVEAEEGTDVVIIAGGLGLAPIRPAIHTYLARREKFRRFNLLYGARTPDDLLYRDELEQWRSRFDLNVEVTVDRTDDGWFGRVGVVTALLPMADFDPKRTLALVCGPEIMIRYAVRDLIARNVPEDRIIISLERNFQCGVRLCGHCQVGPYFVCADGPVFSHSKIGRYLEVREV
jgi:NAD(P)H-flavin reductase